MPSLAGQPSSIPMPAAPRATLVDADVIEACQRGDAEAFRQLFDAYQTRVYSLALHITGDHGAAADVAQQVFVALFKTIARFRRDAAFDTWLYRITIRACWREHRRRRRFVSLDETAEPRARPHGASAEGDYLRRERIEAVRTAIAGLGPKLRAPLVLRHLDGLSYEEIATVLDCSTGTVASRLNRARAQLAGRLAHLHVEAAP